MGNQILHQEDTTKEVIHYYPGTKVVKKRFFVDFRGKKHGMCTQYSKPTLFSKKNQVTEESEWDHGKLLKTVKYDSKGESHTVFEARSMLENVKEVLQLRQERQVQEDAKIQASTSTFVFTKFGRWIEGKD